MIRSTLAAHRADRAITQALARFGEGDASGATAILETALRKDPDNAELTLELAGVVESDERAAELAVRAATLAPDDPLVALRVSRVHVEVGRFDDAERWLDQAERLEEPDSPLRPMRLWLSGVVAGYQADWHRARQLFYAAFDADPGGADYGAVLVSELIDAGDYAAADDVLTIAQRHLPDDEQLSSWRTFLDRGAPRLVWTAELQLSPADDSPLLETASTARWRVGQRASDEHEFRTAVLEAASTLSATISAFDDVEAHPVAQREMVFGRFENVPINDVVFVPSDRHRDQQ